jgi:hypothetical protein
MGRMSLIIVLGFIIIAGVTFVSLREVDMRSTDNTITNAYSVDRNFSAKDIAGHAIQMHLKQQGINTSDSTWMNCITSITSQRLSSVGATLDTFLFNATAVVNGVEKNMTARVVYNARNVPVAHSPVTIHGNQASVSLSSISYINGDNVTMDDMDGDAAYDKYGITLTRADTVSLKLDMGEDTIKVVGNNKIPSMNQVNSDYYEDVNKYIQLYKGLADTSVLTGVLPGGQYGTEEAPKVIYINGSTHMAGDVSGYGILAIEGSFSTTDTCTLNWKGLVINQPEPDSNNVTLYLADSSAIYGALVSGANAMSEVNCVGEVVFDIINDEVVPGVDYKVRAQVLGAELSQEDGSGDVSAEVTVYVGGDDVHTWSDVRYADMDAWVDHRNQPSPEYYIWEDGEGQTHPAGSPVKIECDFADGWPTISSDENSDHLVVLRNGDDAPAMKASSGQADVESWLGAYIDSETGLIRLGNNQAIYLFEANSDNPWPKWENWSAWWINKGYHKDSETYEYHWWYRIPTDQMSYEYCNYSSQSRAQFLSTITEDLRDFQDCVVLATLFEPPDEPPVINPGDTTSNNKPVKIQNSQEAINLVNQMMTGINADTNIVSIEWWDGGEKATQ